MRTLSIVVLAAVALPLLAMPTKQELKQAEGLVQELMRTERNAFRTGDETRAAVAKAAIARAEKAESDAAKMLLFKGAFTLYVRQGAIDEAVGTLRTLKETIPDIPPQVMTNMIESALRKMPEDVCSQFYGLYRAAEHGKVKVGMVQLWEGGPYWAEMNIGAKKPEEFGYYFWWGDTVGYKCENDAWVASDGSSSNFSFEGKKSPTYGKSVQSLRDEGWTTVDGNLTPEHDAAHVQWGGGWRMPTNQEIIDLSDKCEWTRTTTNGVKGYLVRGKGVYASASIFLPAAARIRGTSLFDSHGYGGNYWSSFSAPDRNNAKSEFAASLNFWPKGHGRFGSYRYEGFSIRPVQGVTK